MKQDPSWLMWALAVPETLYADLQFSDENVQKTDIRVKTEEHSIFRNGATSRRDHAHCARCDEIGHSGHSCAKCGHWMFAGIWALTCHYCLNRTYYPLPYNPVETWTDEHIPGRYGKSYANVTNHVKKENQT